MGKEKKSFAELVRENPDAYDYPDVRPGPSNYGAKGELARMPEFVRQKLKENGKLEKYLRAAGVEDEATE